jgi:hypothetical protein
MSGASKLTYRYAVRTDRRAIQKFVDFWLSGRAKAKGIKGGGNDYFVTRNQHKGYLHNSIVLICECEDAVVAWAVKTKKNVLIHLLVDARQRGRGIGAKMLATLNPDIIRSKSDQLTGDPAPFYEKYGYMRFLPENKVGKKDNIDLMVRRTKKAANG